MKILFIYPNYSSFVKTDYQILSTQHHVTLYHFRSVKGLFKNFIQFSKLFFFLVLNFKQFDAVYIWFADLHSFLPVIYAKIFRKKSFVVIGGYDVARIRSLNYGVFNSTIRGYCALYTMKRCTLNIAVSKYVERKIKWIAKGARIKLIYNCVNFDEINTNNNQKENLILTVGLINSERTFYLKGIDTFYEVARLLPQYSFVIIGFRKKLQERFLPRCPENVLLIGSLEHEAIKSYYKRAKIYCQLSRSESFGLSIVEAMYFGCVPVVTNVGGMPEVINGFGNKFKCLPQEMANYILNYFQNEKMDYAFAIQDYIEKHFSYEKRKEVVLSECK